MASTITAWSPSSLQLRLALNYGNSKKYPPIFGRARLGFAFPVNKRFFVDQERGTTGLGRKRDGRLCAGSDSTVDAFSGWSESDDDPNSEESGRSKWFIGAIGAGVGGVVLLTGLTFAALSLNKRKTSGTKQQMVPLTAEQELILSSDEHKDTAEELASESDYLKQENENSVAQTDADSRDYNITSGTDGRNSTRDTLNGSDAANIVSLQEDLKHELPSDDVNLDIVEANSRSLDLAESQNVVTSDSKDLDIAGNTSEQNTANVEQITSSHYDANPQDVNTEQLDEILSLAGGQSSSPSINPPLDTDIGSSVMVNVSVNSKSNANSEPSLLRQGPEDDSLSPSYDPNINLNGSPVSGKKNMTSQEVGYLSKTGQYEQFVSSSSPNTDNDGDGLDKVGKSSSYSPSSGFFFSAAGIPAPSKVTTSHQEVPGKVLVPAVVDQIQGQALAALQVLKVIEAEAQPGDLCTRREYARWLVTATSALSRNTISKVYPAMYIENVTDLAFDDIAPDDPDFPSIQGLAEAGLIASKLSQRDMNPSSEKDQSPFYFCPGSPLSRQDLVSWKMAVEKNQLPVADRKVLHQVSGFIDVDKIHPDACPAIIADLSAGEQGIIGLAFGYTRLFQPDKPVTKAQAAIALATGEASDIVNEELARIEAESAAEKAVSAHNALVAEVEKDINASFERELLIEKEKIDAVERMAEEAKRELEKLRAEREQDNIALSKERAVVESEMELLSRLRREVEDQLQSLMNNKVELSYEKERIGKLREQAESENQEIARLQYELEVERKALSLARSWAEDEAKRAREQAKALEEARNRWEKQGIKVVVDDDLREEASVGVTWLAAGKEFKVEETVDRAENLVEKLKIMMTSVVGKSRDVINKIIHKIGILISNLKEWTQKAGQQTGELKDATLSNISSSAQGLQRSTQEFSFAVKEGAKRVVGDCREGVEKISQKFKT